MSVIINNMDMPTCCKDCELLETERIIDMHATIKEIKCFATQKRLSFYGTPKFNICHDRDADCPLTDLKGVNIVPACDEGCEVPPENATKEELWKWFWEQVRKRGVKHDNNIL